MNFKVYDALPPSPQLFFFSQKSSAAPICAAILLIHSTVISPVSAGVSNKKKLQLSL